MKNLIHLKKPGFDFRDHGLPLRCRAEVPGLHGAEEDSITMHVACKFFEIFHILR